jgi:acyl carrier protein
MNRAIAPRVRNILADLLSVSEATITAESSPESLASWDSLQHLNFVLSVEQEFGVEFKPEEIESITSVRCMIETLENKLTNPSK